MRALFGATGLTRREARSGLWRLSVLVALAVLSCSGGGEVPAARRGGAIPRLAYEKYTLRNGLQIILHVDRKLPVVHVNQWFHVGSKNEKPGRTGLAHLFEHMMFEGSRNAPDGYFAYAERAGANVLEGGTSGSTNQDTTNYSATVPSGNLENLLWLESDRLATLPDTLTKAKLDTQREVVRNERRQRYENVPYGRSFELIQENLFPPGHPYSWMVMGSQEDLGAASLEDVKEFFRTYYAPSNLSLVIAGDFDPAQARILVARYFAGIPPGPPLVRPARWIATLSGEKTIEATDQVPQERIYIVWPGPEYFAAGDAALDLTSAILTDGPSSRLNRALVHDQGLCSSVTSYNNSQEIAGLFAVVATARPGVDLARVEAALTGEIGRLAKDGPAPAELARAKTKQEYATVSGLERIGGFGGKADLLNQYNTALGDPGKLEADLTRYRSVSPNDLRAAVATWLATRNRLVIRFHPQNTAREEGSNPDRSKQPPLGADRAFEPPAVKSTVLDNGLQVFVVERRELPKVSVTLATRAGSAADPAGMSGMAQMTVAAMLLGTTNRKAMEIADTMGDLGASFTAAADRDSSRIRLDVLKSNLDEAFAVLADAVRNPSFPGSEIERERKRQLDALSQASSNPGVIAARVRAMLAFGREHPYGRPVAGLPDSVAKITREDVARFQRTFWRPGSSALVFAGDVTLAQATELARRHLGAWSGGSAPAIAIPPTSPYAAGTVYVVDRPDAAQTVVSQVLTAPPRGNPDEAALRLANAVWGGGGFGNRLNLNLGERRGYSYWVSSTLDQFRGAGYWYSTGSVATDKTRESVIELESELEGLAGRRPITAEEVDAARVRRIRGYSQEFDSLARIAGKVADPWTLGMSTEELRREVDESKALTLDMVRAAARQNARPDRAMLLLVGDASRITPAIRGLNLGRIVMLDAEGKPAGR